MAAGISAVRQMKEKRNRLTVQAAMLGMGLWLACFVYVISIGPVYFCWAAFSANMTTHGQIERFYSPILEGAPSWVRSQAHDLRDVSRLAGHHLTERPLRE